MEHPDEREFAAPDGRIWMARVRPERRRDDDRAQLAIELESLGERRVVVCDRSEWDSPDADLLALLDRSVPGGASRSAPPAESDPEPDPPAPLDDPSRW